jgi:Mrp family chromosome partitioning ATPase
MQYVVEALALAGLLGLGGVGLARRGARSDRAAVETVLETTVLGEVAEPLTLSALPALEVGTAAATAFDQLGRSVRDALGADEACHTVVVTGPLPHDDNAWLGANIAIALARRGQEVLLVDGRLSDRDRRPMTPGPEAPGLYDVLQGVRLERAISPGPVDRLSVLPAGDAGAVPTTRIVESRFASLTDEAGGRFETVVVLGPALSTGRDSAVMARTGAVLLAVAPSVSPRELAACGQRLREQSVPLVGAVLVGRH